MNRKTLLLALSLFALLHDGFAQDPNYVKPRVRNKNANKTQSTVSDAVTASPNGTITPTLNTFSNSTSGSPQKITDTVPDYDTLNADAVSITKINSLRRNSTLISERDLKIKAINLGEKTSEEAIKKRDSLRRKVLPVAQSIPAKKNPINTAVLAMPDLREEDATYNEFVWREIDGREKVNHSFIYKGKNQQAGRSLYSSILSIFNEEYLIDETTGGPIINPLNRKPIPAVTAFERVGGDDFIKPMISDSLDSLIIPVMRINYIKDGNRIIKQYTKSAKVQFDSVYSFLLKEQYVFDKKYSQLFRRIIALAPVASIPGTSVEIELPNGQKRWETPIEKKVLFWINYDEIRPYLSKKMVYNPLNISSQMSWSDVLDLGYFNATIYKTTIENENDRTFKELFKKDNIKRLEYAEKIRQKIFDQEQDRWVY